MELVDELIAECLLCAKSRRLGIADVNVESLGTLGK